MKHFNLLNNTRWFATVILLLTFCIGKTWGTDIAKWGKVSISKNTNVTASGGDANNNGKAKFQSTKDMTSAGGSSSKCYYGGSAGGAVITFNSLNLSSYSSIQMTFYARASQSGFITVAYSTDGTNWVNVGAASVTTSEGQKTITGIPWFATYLRLTHSKTSGSLYFGTIIISGTSAASKTVTWYVNGSTTTTGSPTTSVPSGGTVAKLPTDPSSCDPSKVFVGWTNSAYSHATDAPSVLFTTVQGAPTVTSNTSYYAVFANRTAFTRVTSTSDLAAGKQIVVVDNQNSKVLTTVPGYATAPTESSSKITPSNNMIWFLEANSTNWKLKTGSTYLGTYNTEDNTDISYSSSNNIWTIGSCTNGTNHFYFKNTSGTNFTMQYNSSKTKWIGYATSSYASSSYNTERLYVATLTNYATSCAACEETPSVGAASLNGSFSLSSVGVQCASASAGDGCSLSEYGFVWGTSNTSGHPNKDDNVVTNAGAYAANYTNNLTSTFVAGNTYYYRGYAKNNGDNYGYSSVVQSFTPYTVNYNKNNGSAGGSAPSQQVVNTGGTVTLAPATGNFTLTGYHITKWAAGSAGGTQYTPNTTSPTISGNTTFYAIWEANTYAITLNANTGSGSSPASVNATYNAHALSSAITNPIKTDYIFEGWNTKADGSGLTVIGTDGELIADVSGYTDEDGNWTKAGTETLYAKWTEHSYTNYRTLCCTDPGTALSISSANSVATGGTVSLTSTGGNGGTVTWSVVNGTGTATVAGTTLTAGYIGTVTVKAHQDANTVLGTEYCAQDAEQAFTVVSSTINVTGVEVSPTTKAIVPGETFDITPTISPSNATDKSVSWTSSASDKASVSSGTVTGVAAGSATITCTTTDGSKTATTAVTVYGVTMQALDEDGNAIAVGGPGTPSRTGASISPAADAGNYVFKEWAISGASLGSSASTKANTITNPTGAVTVTAKYYKPRTVKWSVNGNDSYNTGGPTTTVAYNGTISTVPTNPSGLACAGTFVAWTDAAHNNGTTAKDDDSYYGSALYTDAGDFPSITAATTTFYAVFAEQDIYSGRVEVNTTNSGVSGGGYESTTFTVDEIEFAYNNWQLSTNIQAKASNSPSLNNNEAFPRRIDKIVVKQTGTARAVTISGKNFLNSAAAEAAGKTYESASITQPSTAATMTFTFPANKSYPFFEMNTPGNAVYMDSIVIYYKEIITSNYVTECDANIVRVTYNANGGTTSCTNTTTNKTEDFTICSSVPTRDYYTFAGWLCSADSKTYAANATIDDAAINGDFTLTAQWTPVPYDITYELDGGTNSGSNPATYNVTTATITLQNPTRDHDRFDGWYDNGSFTGDAVTSIPLGSHGDITLYAKWAERHTIVFDYSAGDGGTTTTIYRADDENLEDDVAGQGSVPDDPDAPSACSAKVFKGWSESEIDGETDTEPADLMDGTGTVNADKTYYAVWAKETSSSGPVTVFEDALYGKADNNTTFSTYGNWDSFGYVYGRGTSTEGVRVSNGDYGGYLQLKANIGLAAVDTIRFKVMKYSAEDAEITLSSYSGSGTYDNASSAKFTASSTTEWEEKTCILRSADATTDISFEGTAKKRIFVKDIKITKAGTVYTYSKYATSCCATNITLSQNDPDNGTIAFGKTTVGTCGDKEVSLTITPAAGYQLHSYEVATGSSKVAAKSVSPAISLDNNSSAVQNITLTFADEANGAYDVTASFSLMTVTSWTWTMNSEAIPDPLNLYVGQSAQLDVAYTPSGVDASKKTYTRDKDNTYINFGGGSYTNYTTISGKASTGENTTAVTFTHADGPTKTVNVKVLPLPLTHFVDLVHGKPFADVAATIEANALSATKTTPTSDDWTTPNANDCEGDHLHLVGWIREDWPALVAYLNGTGDAPTTVAITGAGNDGSGNAYFFEPGASINTQTFNGVTFYAVWAQIE